MWRIILSVFLITPAFGQRPASTVQGDVYLTTRGGNLVRGAGLTVALLPVRPAVRDSLLGLCRTDSLLNVSAQTWAGQRSAELGQALTDATNWFNARGEEILASYKARASSATDQEELIELKEFTDRALASARAIVDQRNQFAERSFQLGMRSDSQKLHLAQQGLRAQLAELLLANAARKTETGMAAHYSLVGIRPGHYALYATTELGDGSYVWWKEITIQGSSPLQQDLNNKVAYEWPAAFCELLKQEGP